MSAEGGYIIPIPGVPWIYWENVETLEEVKEILRARRESSEMAWDGVVERRRYSRHRLTYRDEQGQVRQRVVLSESTAIPYREVVVTPTEPEKRTSPIDHRGKAGR